MPSSKGVKRRHRQNQSKNRKGLAPSLKGYSPPIVLEERKRANPLVIFFQRLTKLLTAASRPTLPKTSLVGSVHSTEANEDADLSESTALAEVPISETDEIQSREVLKKALVGLIEERSQVFREWVQSTGSESKDLLNRLDEIKEQINELEKRLQQ